MFHDVCYHDKIILHLNICSRRNKQMAFSDQQILTAEFLKWNVPHDDMD